MNLREMSQFRMKDLTLSQWPDEPDEENRRDEDHWYTKPVSTQDMKRLIN